MKYLALQNVVIHAEIPELELGMLLWLGNAYFLY